MTGLPDGIFDDNGKLTELLISHNQLTGLPDGIFTNLTKLRELDLSQNNLEELPDGVFENNGKLNKLNIWSNQLTDLPDGAFTNLTKLLELDLSGNELTDLPEGAFSNLAELQVLWLAGNPEFAELPDGVFDGLSSLESLHLQAMSLQELPDGVFDNQSGLKFLNLSSNDLAALPEGIFDSLTNVRLLDLGQNSLTTLPEGPFDGLNKLLVLYLANNSLTELPEGTFDDLSSLTDLYLYDNQLTELHDGAFDNLSGLKYLEMQRNQLTALPDGIGNLSKLLELRLYNNEITELPDGMLDSMTKLVVLSMNNSGPTGLPEGIKNLTKLQRLGLGRMEISEVPAGFFDKLTDLRELDLGVNHLSDLPAGVLDKLTKLRKLDLGFNEFTDIPSGVFKEASNLEEVVLWGNPGDPFHFFVLLDSLGEDSFNVRMSNPAPFPVTAYLAAVGGRLSETSVVLPMGTTTAKTVTVTRGPQGDTPVTVSVRVEIETKWGNRIVSDGMEVSGVRVYTDAPQQLGSSQQGNEFHSVCDRTEAVRTAILSKLTGIGDCADVDANHLRSLISLSLNDSGVTSLKTGDFDDLLLLTSLSIAENGLTSLPVGIFSDDLTNLMYLELNDNELTSLPEGAFDNLTGLRTLNLKSNRLAELPEDIFNDLTSLTKLYLDSNSIGEWPEGVFDNLSSLTSLGLRDNGINQVPDDPFDGVTALAHLDMAYNDITELPDGAFDNLTALNSLILSHNDIVELPDGIFDQLRQLETLYIGATKISELPDGVFDNLTAITTLSLSHNNIVELPDGIFDQLRQIETLYIGANKISELPDGVFDNLTNMERLEISENLLIELPDGAFDGLTNLRSVMARYNLARPLLLTAKLERLKDTEVAVMVTEAAPFDIEVDLTADHGTISASTVTVAAGSRRSDSVTLTPSGTEPVTVSMSSARFLTDASDYISGLGVGLGRSLTPSEETEANQKATGAPEITGTARVGERLTASTSTIADANGITEADFQFYWIRSDGETDFFGQPRGQEYTVRDNDAGMTIKVRVKFTDDADYDETLTSSSTETVSSSVPRAPSFSAVRSTLTGELSVTWSAPRDGGSAITEYTVQWKEDAGSWDTAADVSEATTTDTSYTISGLSLSTRYAIRVFATNDVGNGPPSWNAIAVTVARVSDQPNTPATGAPSISGTVQVRETLTADTSGIRDSNGLDNVSYSYQWIRSDGTTDTDIAGATSSTYLVTTGDVGKTIKVRVSFSDDAENEESLTSAATAAVSAAVPGVPRNVAVERGGTGELDVTWAAPASDGGASITGYTVQWKESSGSWDTAADVSEATVTSTSYTITSLRLQVEYAVRVIATNSVGDSPASGEVTETADAQTSQQQGPVKKSVLVTQERNTPATGAPSIIGTLEAGQSLNADTSSISDGDGLTTPAFVYQWLADDTDITGATGQAYVLVDSDQGKAIKVTVSFTDDANNEESLTSEAVVVPVRPHGLTASVSDGDVVLTWNQPVGFSYLYDYQILRNRPEVGETEPLVYVNTGNAETSYTDTDVEPGVLYIYRVKAASYFSRFTDASKPAEIRTAESAPNTPATGAPAISGDLVVGQTLSAVTSAIEDADGLDKATFAYQWVADDADIPGATASRYTLVDSDGGKAIKVTVSFTDDAGNDESLTSVATAEVVAGLTAEFLDIPSSHDGDTAFTFELRFSEEPKSDFSYKTLRDHAFTVTGGEVTKARRLDDPSNIRWEITVTPDGSDSVTVVLPATTDCTAERAVCTGDGKMLSSEVAFAVAGPEGEEQQTPAQNNPATGAPAISGTVRVGETLNADTSTIADSDGTDKAAYAYQWLADDTDISGATVSRYTLADSDEGKVIKVRVSFTDDAGNAESLTSLATAAVAARSPLTAEFLDIPSSHDGETAFTFELRFSEEFELSYKTLRDHAFTVAGGEVAKARRLDPEGGTPNIRWEITFAPDGNGNVGVVLPATTDCTSQGAICTADGRMLSTRVELTVAGPGG